MRAGTEPRLINRTGISVSPELSQELIDAALSAKPSSPGNDHGMATVRIDYGRNAEPIGSIPLPVDPEAAEAEAEEPDLAVLMDKLGERLAFERTGVRIYQTLLSKFETSGPIPGGPTLQDLLHIQEEELGHFELLKGVIESLGGDPTAVTPSADVAAVLSGGIPQVLADPRTTLRQGLDAVLVAELTDNDGWELLIKLCEQLDESELAAQFRLALESEAEHLQNVRRWIEKTTVMNGS
jgi:tRNA isopentenyl-2-thiomethyl-A-37 hydroxylase MiaE